VKQRNAKDILFATITAAAAGTVVVFVLSILFVLVQNALPAIREFGLAFVVTDAWNPVKQEFGGAAPLYGSLVTTLLALLLAVPVSIGIAIFVTEIAPNFLKGFIGGAIELLAAIPSIIYGMWGLFTLAPIMSQYIEPALQSSLGSIPFLAPLVAGTPRGVDILTASLILSIMITPFIASIARDAFKLTPPEVKESAYAVGATQWEVVRDVIIPYSKFGVFGGVIIALGRALGETMAVAFVLGNKHQITVSLLEAATTITVALANEFNEADTDLYLSSLYYLALLLFLFSFSALAFARYLIIRNQRNQPGA
jgi:phosphate transport system permease protein